MPKRTHGEGTIYQRKDGLWRGELTLGYDDDGKRIKKVFHSKDLEVVQKKLNDERYRLDRNIVVRDGDYTVEEWTRFWLENYKSNQVKSKTYDNYEYALDLHIAPAIGKIKLGKIRPDDVQRLYNQQHKRGLSTNTIRIVHVTLSQAFEQAVKNGLMYSNPCKATVRPKTQKKKVTAMTSAQQERFLEHCGNSTFHLLFVFLLNTGLRVGEALPLVWTDIDFGRPCVTVSKTMSDIVNRDGDGGRRRRVVVYEPKTAHGEREVPLNKSAVAALGKLDGGRHYVFASKNGTMLLYRNIRRALGDLLKAANLPDSITIHALRHSFATRLLEKGVNPKVVSALLGHATIQITLDTYSHAMPEIQNDAVGLLD